MGAGDIPGWWIWAFWGLPGSYGLRTMAITECLSPLWGRPSQVNPQQTVGEALLQANGLLYPFWWVWIDFGAMLGLLLAWLVVVYLAMLFLGGAPCDPLSLPTCCFGRFALPPPRQCV